MNTNTVLLIIIPFFLLLISVETIYSYRKQKKLYNFKDSLVSILLGVLAVLNRTLTKGLWLALWMYLYQFSFFKIPPSIWGWVLLILCNELVYYWFHRWSHKNKYLWAIHVNHHSSEYFNFSTGARQPFFSLILHNIFWIPLLFLGFDPLMIFVVENIGGLFGFLTHTQLIKNIPYLDKIIVAPVHHSIHHASNKEYLDKNFGNLLIIFDRLFGTFQKEEPEIEIKFGLTKNINTYNPIKVIFHKWIDIFRGNKANPD